MEKKTFYELAADDIREEAAARSIRGDSYNAEDLAGAKGQRLTQRPRIVSSQILFNRVTAAGDFPSKNNKRSLKEKVTQVG